jgi:thiamine-monophosphate kinase
MKTGERALIESLRAVAARHASRLAAPGILRVGIGDDCAILRPRAGQEIVVTTDLFLEQVHFRRDWRQPEAAGHRCLARGLSDIAAMGATPVAAFLSFALPPELAGSWARSFLDGLLRLARLHNVPLAGGDTAQAPSVFFAPPRSVRTSRHADSETSPGRRPGPNRTAAAGALFAADIVLIGSVPRGQALLRSGARPGDSIYVTGALGGAAAELALLQQDPGSYARTVRGRSGHPHLFPNPRLQAGRALLKRATAAIDLSDGLSTDLAHLCRESGVAAEIEAALIPIHPLASRRSAASLALAIERALHGGEDYELLFTAPPRRRFPQALAGTPIHRIGTILPPARGRPRLALLDADGKRRPLRNGGWEHLRLP